MNDALGHPAQGRSNSCGHKTLLTLSVGGSARLAAKDEATYFNDKIQAANVFASASLTPAFGGMGLVPKLPVAPLRMDVANLTSASF